MKLLRHVPLIRRPFYQRDVAIRERDRLGEELAEARGALAAAEATLAEREAEASGVLKRLAWYSVDLPWQVADGRGMIFDDERRLLYVLARDYYSGAGKIIDGGTYIGDSSLAIGFGLKDRDYPAGKVIHAFDLFIVDARSVELIWVERDAPGRVVKAGDNVQFVYEGRTAPVAQYIQIHPGDVTRTPWSGEPIEILFSDISKNWDLNDYILQNWFPSLIPERGILIQQDQVQEIHVWLGITMEMLAGHFDFIDYVKNSSMVYRLRHNIPAVDLARCLGANISADDMERAYLGYLDRFRRIGAGRYSGWHLGMVEAGLIVTYAFHIGDMDKARHAFARCEDTFGHVPDTMARLRGIQEHLDGLTPCPGARIASTGASREAPPSRRGCVS